MNKNTLTLRVMLDHKELVFRDIQIAENAKLIELHYALLDSFGFNHQEMASFYESDSAWSQGQEIPMESITEKGESMDNTTVKDAFVDDESRLIYVYDFLLMWCFMIQAIEVKELESVGDLPKLVHEIGTAPDQYSKEPVDQFEIEGGDMEDEDDAIFEAEEYYDESEFR